MDWDQVATQVDVQTVFVVSRWIVRGMRWWTQRRLRPLVQTVIDGILAFDDRKLGRLRDRRGEGRPSPPEEGAAAGPMVR